MLDSLAEGLGVELRSPVHGLRPCARIQTLNAVQQNQNLSFQGFLLSKIAHSLLHLPCSEVRSSCQFAFTEYDIGHAAA